MEKDDFRDYTDLTREDLDPELFAAALAVQHIGDLLRHGESLYGQPDDENALRLEDFERFILRALENAQRTKHFERYWYRLQQVLPHIRIAREKGKDLFQEHLARAMTNQEEMEYLSLIDFAVDCYASVAAKNTYPENAVMQAWTIHGYMLAWRRHFLNEDDISL